MFDTIKTPLLSVYLGMLGLNKASFSDDVFVFLRLFILLPGSETQSGKK